MARILFVCIGNAVRSQMAEGFARTYGHETVKPASCGLAPAMRVDPKAVKVMEDIGINITEHFPKPFDMMASIPFDLIVNISGHPLPTPVSCPIKAWDVTDPVGRTEEEYRKARDLIQRLTMQLLEEVSAASEQDTQQAQSDGETALSRRRLLNKIP